MDNNKIIFDEIVAEIKEEVIVTSNNLGWRFLVNSKNTIAKNNGIYLITLNPGGDEIIPEQGQESCENGSAYLNEVWGNNEPGKNPLQIQIQLMFKKISEYLRKSDYISVLENSVSGYFIPFRSPNIKTLKDKGRIIKFSEKIWKKILLHSTHIKLIIVIDNDALKSMLKIFSDNPFEVISEEC